jgi:hypothetical protein
MPDVVAQLDPATLAIQRETLVTHGLETLAEGLDDEALAGLTALGQHPARLRSDALSLVPVQIRLALDAYRLIDPNPARRRAWTFTALGERAADLLATHAPPLDAAEEERLEARYAERLAQLEAELGLP